MEQEEMYDAEGRSTGTGDVREALILAGIGEIEEHGLADFSLRRVASACGVSCAAPYKHFKSKDDLIGEILRYIREKWEMLQRHICEVSSGSDASLLLELCLSDIRFWIGNPHFRAVHMRENNEQGGRTHLGACAEQVLLRLSASFSAEEASRLCFTVRSLVYGAILMLEDGTLENTPATFRMLRTTLEAALFEKKS